MKLAAHDPSLTAYVTLTALLVVTPGSSTAMVIRHVLRGGRTAGLGVTAIVTRAPLVFSAIKVGGAAYLAFLGARALIRAATPSGDALGDAGILDSTGRRRSAFRDGVAVNLLNPPIATFYLAVVPSFMPVPSAGRFALLAMIHIGMAFVCHAAWAAGFDALQSVWARPAARRVIDAAVGAALLALAFRMLR